MTKRLQYVSGPIGLSLAVIGAGWSVLAPRELPVVSRTMLAVGAALIVFSLWGRRDQWLNRSGSKRARVGAGALASSGIALAFLLLVNFFAARYHERWDLTRTRSFSLHPAVLRVVQSVDKDVDITAFFATVGLLPRAVQERLDSFTRENPRLKAELVDPNKRPDLIDKLGVRGSGVTVVTCGERRVAFPGYDEDDLAAAIEEVSRETSKKIYWVLGHGERALDAKTGSGYQRLIQELRHEYYEVATLTLGGGENVPQDAALVVFADPRKPLTEAEAQTYQQYLRGGGRVLALVDVDFEEQAGQPHPLAALLERWGVRPQPAVVMDPRARTGEMDPRVAVGDNYGNHPAVASLRGSLTVFPLVRPVEYFKVLEDQQIFQNVLVAIAPGVGQAGKDPYADDDLARVRDNPTVDLAKQKLYIGQPVNLVVAAWRKFEPQPGSSQVGREARLVLAGDANFLDDANLDLEANRDLVQNVVRWLTGNELLIRREGEQRIAKTAMAVNPAQETLVRTIVFLVPTVIFFTGWIVWFLRRSK